MGKLKPDLA